MKNEITAPELIVVIDPRGVYKVRFVSYTETEESICFMMLQRIRPMLMKIKATLQGEFPEIIEEYDRNPFNNPIFRVEMGLMKRKKEAPAGEREAV